MAVTVEELQILISAEVAEALKNLKSVQKTVQEVNKVAAAPARAVNAAVKEATSAVQEVNAALKETTSQATEPITAAMKKEQEKLKKMAEFQKQTAKDIDNAIARLLEKESAERAARAERTAKTAEQEQAAIEARAAMASKQHVTQAPNAPNPATDSTKQYTLWQQVMRQYYAKLDYIKKQLNGAGLYGNEGTSRLTHAAGTLRKALQAAGNAAKRTGETIGSVFRKAASIVQFTAKKITGFAKSVFKQTHREGKKSIGYIAGAIRRTIVMSSLYAVLRTITSGITEGFKNLAQASKETNATMSSLATSALYLKNSIGSALLPIVQALTPAITAITDKLASLLNVFGMLSARIFNNATTYTVAKKAAVDYAKTVKGVANQLAGFDELNVLQQNSTPGMPKPGAMFEQVAIPEETLSLADKIKQMFSGTLNSADWNRIKEAAKTAAAGISESINEFLTDTERWSRLGRTISEGINTAFAFAEGFSDKLNWRGIGTVLSTGLNSLFTTWDASQTGKAIYKTLNGVVSTIYTFFTQTKWGDIGKKLALGLNTAIAGTDFSMIGKTFASKWNAVTDFLHDLIQEYDWTKAGASIANAINGWFAEIDWAKAGKTVSNGAIGVFSTIGEAVRKVDWKQIGEDIQMFLVSIDWSGIVKELATVVGNAFGALGSLIWGLLEDAFLSIGDYFSDEIEDAGGNIALGLFNGIIHGLGDIVKWQYDNIFKPFLDGFMSLFGIHSPSTVMFEQGVFIMQGLGNGITSLREKTLKIFSDIVSDIKAKVGGIITYINGDFKTNWATAWEGVQSKFKTIWDGMSDYAKGIVDTIGEWVRTVREKIDGVLNSDDGDYSIPDTISGAAPTIRVKKKMAKGGVVTQPTLAWTGEYPGASSNPEIVAPQSIMRETVVEANAPMVAAMYDMAIMIVQAIESNAVEVSVDSKGLLSAVKKENDAYLKATGRRAFN